MSNEPEAKRARTDSDLSGAGAGVDDVTVFREGLLATDAVDALKDAYGKGSPYKHGLFQEIFNPEFLKAARTEMMENLCATFKETDIYKFRQTGDLANIDGLDADEQAKLKNVLKLSNSLYSPEFRAAIQKITGCPDLTEEVDCAVNIHPQGGHLCVHDDVIGNRAVSYIIYLTDPESEWQETDGGALELYPCVPGQECVPSPNPTKLILPRWNNMAFFAVDPGVSFHAVQEVIADKVRCSLQGWYHAAHPPAGMEKATRSQLADHDDDSTPFEPLADSERCDLSDGDREILSQYINEEYLKEETINAVAEAFKSEGTMQLRRFLRKDVADRVRSASKAEDDADNVGKGRLPTYTSGQNDSWTAVGPPHTHRFLQLVRDSAVQHPAGSMAAEMASVRSFLRSGALCRLIGRFVGAVPDKQRCVARRFRAGLDYTLAQHPKLVETHDLIEATLCFVDDGSAKRRSLWASSDVGGFECYMPAADEKGDDAAIYKTAADTDDVISEPAAHNSLSLVRRGNNILRFVKYVSATAPGSRWDLSAEFHVPR